MIYFDIYKYMVTKWKHGIYIHKKFTFNESLDNASMSILEPTKIGESYYEDGFAMFKTWIKFERNKENNVTENKLEKTIQFYYTDNIIYDYLIRFICPHRRLRSPPMLQDTSLAESTFLRINPKSTSSWNNSDLKDKHQLFVTTLHKNILRIKI